MKKILTVILIIILAVFGGLTVLRLRSRDHMVDENGVTLRYAEDEDGSVARYSTAPADENYVYA